MLIGNWFEIIKILSHMVCVGFNFENDTTK
jgi:hypothetical protein